jgi:hypothetical protein
MNLQQLQAKLLAAARRNPPSDQVPFAFEKRIMARLAKPIVDAWSLWGKALWRAAAACVIAVVLLGSWSLQTESSDNTDLSQQFEQTVFAALDEQSAISIGEDTW